MPHILKDACESYLLGVSHRSLFRTNWRPLIKGGVFRFALTNGTPRKRHRDPMEGFPAGTNPLAVLMKRLSDTDDHHFLCMIWAIHAIQGGRVEHAARFLNHPREAATTDPMSSYMAHKWELETLIAVDLNTPKDIFPDHRKEPIPTREFSALADIVNLLKLVEDGQSQDRIDGDNIMREMHRIGHRQFPWQTGWDNIGSMYRHLFVYGQGLCAEYFEATYGLTISDFVGCCFALYSRLQGSPWTQPLQSTDPIKVAEGALSKTMAMVSDELWVMKRESVALLRKNQAAPDQRLPVAYYPSYLRIKPIIRSTGLGNLIIAPLHQLILFRATVGLFYDLIGGGTKVLNDARDRFEQYGRKVIEAYCPDLKAEPAVVYKYQGNDVDTPDILLRQDDKIVAVFECKATKLTFQAQYGVDPVEEARNGYVQIAKAIYQLWRFFSHVRRGFINLPVAEDASAIVLTMEPWTQMSKELRVEMMEEAEKIVAAKDPEITDADKRFPIFVPIAELERILSESSAAQMLDTFKAATNARYDGWSIREVRRDAVKEVQERKLYPFDPSELLTWWKELKDGAERRKLPETEAATDEKSSPSDDEGE